MVSQSDRVIKPISTKELERRWVAVPKGMDEHKIEVMLMQNLSSPMDLAECTGNSAVLVS